MMRLLWESFHDFLVSQADSLANFYFMCDISASETNHQDAFNVQELVAKLQTIYERSFTLPVDEEFYRQIKPSQTITDLKNRKCFAKEGIKFLLQKCPNLRNLKLET